MEIQDTLSLARCGRVHQTGQVAGVVRAYKWVVDAGPGPGPETAIELLGRRTLAALCNYDLAQDVAVGADEETAGGEWAGSTYRLPSQLAYPDGGRPTARAGLDPVHTVLIDGCGAHCDCRWACPPLVALTVEGQGAEARVCAHIGAVYAYLTLQSAPALSPAAVSAVFDFCWCARGDGGPLPAACWPGVGLLPPARQAQIATFLTQFYPDLPYLTLVADAAEVGA